LVGGGERREKKAPKRGSIKRRISLHQPIRMLQKRYRLYENSGNTKRQKQLIKCREQRAKKVREKKKYISICTGVWEKLSRAEVAQHRRIRSPRNRGQEKKKNAPEIREIQCSDQITVEYVETRGQRRT